MRIKAHYSVVVAKYKNISVLLKAKFTIWSWISKDKIYLIAFHVWLREKETEDEVRLQPDYGQTTASL